MYTRSRVRIVKVQIRALFYYPQCTYTFHLITNKNEKKKNNGVQETLELTFILLGTGFSVHYFIDFELNDKSFDLKNAYE